MDKIFDFPFNTYRGIESFAQVLNALCDFVKMDQLGLPISFDDVHVRWWIKNLSTGECSCPTLWYLVSGNVGLFQCSQSPLFIRSHHVVESMLCVTNAFNFKFEHLKTNTDCLGIPSSIFLHTTILHAPVFWPSNDLTNFRHFLQKSYSISVQDAGVFRWWLLYFVSTVISSTVAIWTGISTVLGISSTGVAYFAQENWPRNLGILQFCQLFQCMIIHFTGFITLRKRHVGYHLSRSFFQPTWHFAL